MRRNKVLPQADWEINRRFRKYLGMEKRDSADPERVTYTALRSGFDSQRKKARGRIQARQLLQFESMLRSFPRRRSSVPVQFGYKKVGVTEGWPSIRRRLTHSWTSIAHQRSRTSVPSIEPRFELRC
ncbi:MAG: hypothetical protein ACLVAP_14300 [Parasutterella sp.]